MSAINKRKKNYYASFKGKHAKGSHYQLSPGLSGFLFTCNNREKECVRESYNLLNEYIDKIADDDKSKLEKTDDIDDDIAKELQELKTNRRLQQCDTRCNNIVFVKAPDNVDPIKIVDQIFNDIIASQRQKTRFALRLIPISKTCKASLDEIDKCVEELIKASTDLNVDEELTFMIQCKVRNNSDMSRMAIVESVALVIKKQLPKWKVNFDNPSIILNIEVLCKIGCASFLKNFVVFKKYNLIEVVSQPSNKEETVIKSETADEQAVVEQVVIVNNEEDNK